MSTPESQPPPAQKPAASAPPEMRYRYIGFEIHSKRIPRFWKSEEEEAGFAKRVQLGAGMSSLDRDFSLLHVVPVSKADKIIITIVAVVLLATLLMPWVHFRTIAGTDFSLSWGGALGAVVGGFAAAFAGGLAVGLSAVLALALLIGGPLVGLWILVAVWMKAKSGEAYLVRLRRPLRLGYVLFFAGLGLGLLALFGGEVPGYTSWGLINPGESYGVGTLLALLSFGAYAVMAMGLVAGVKSGDL